MDQASLYKKRRNTKNFKFVRCYNSLHLIVLNVPLSFIFCWRWLPLNFVGGSWNYYASKGLNNNSLNYQQYNQKFKQF